MKRQQFAEGAPVYRAGTLQRWRAFGKGWSLLLVGLMPLLAGAQGMRQAWVARYNGPSSSLDSASALAVDSQGNVYVTGRSVGSGTGFDYATVKYDTNGRQLWVARYNGPGNGLDSASALAVDSRGNLYVTGYSVTGGVGSGIDWDYATIKYVPCPGPCPGDVDGSRLVDDSDLLRVLFAFGQVGDRPEDLNCDGVVDDADLLIVLFNFGRRC